MNFIIFMSVENTVINYSFIKKVSSYEKFLKILNSILVDKTIGCLQLDLQKRTALIFIQYFSYIPIICKSKNIKIPIYIDEKTSFLMQKRINSLPNGEYKNKDIFDDLINNTNLVKSKAEVLEWVRKITEEAPVEMDDNLQEIFSTYIGEIFNNGLEHSKTSYVVGSKYSKRTEKIYTFSIYDTGIGIPENVRNYLKKKINDDEALKWALKPGHSTARDSQIPRGAGFNLLHSFAEHNNGEIRILTGHVLYIYNPKDGRKFHLLNNEMIGTLFEMDIVFDPKHKYILA